MIKFDVCIKSGTCGYYDYDHCDMVVQSNIISNQLPTKGDYIILDSEPNKTTKYLVTQVCRSFLECEEFNTIYVIEV